jgi:hypothetical protein
MQALVRADQDTDARTKAHWYALIKSGGEPQPDMAAKVFAPRVYRRGEAARLTGHSLRWIDALARKGLVQRVRLPGSKRGIGILAADLESLIASSAISVKGGAQ